MVFGGELGLKNPKVVGLPTLWRWFPKVTGRPSSIVIPNPIEGVYGGVDDSHDCLILTQGGWYASGDVPPVITVETRWQAVIRPILLELLYKWF